MTIEYGGDVWEVVDAKTLDEGDGKYVTLTIVRVPKPLVDYTDFLWCDVCNRETEHAVHDEHHERDSSHDWKMCTVCGTRRQL